MKKKVPYETYLLIAMLIFLSLGAIYGGISLITDSSGETLHLKIHDYPNYTLKDFFWPGLLLLLLYGILPLLLIFPLVTQPKLPWANSFNIYKKRHWAWTYSLFLGISLVIWIDAQIVLLGYYTFIQILYSLLGLAIIIVCLLPKQISFFAKTHSHHRSNHDKVSEEHEANN